MYSDNFIIDSLFLEGQDGSFFEKEGKGENSFDLSRGILRRSRELFGRALMSFHVMFFFKKVWYAWPLSSTVYN